MYFIETKDFEKLVTESIERLPEPYKGNITNVAFFVEDEPNTAQRKKLGLRPCQSLFGLYEGVPLPERHGGYALSIPDKITVFRLSHIEYSNNLKQLKLQVANTVWHEVAHYFGLGHKRIAELEHKQ